MIAESKIDSDAISSQRLDSLDRSRYLMGLIIGLAATFLPVAVFELYALHHTNHIFIYPVDDTFIHMELGKNFSGSGTWGINPHEFGSASSSLLYTLILTVLSKISSSILVPFIVNLIAGVFIIIAVNRWLSRQRISMTVHIAALLALVIFTPLPVTIISGMEHSLQCLFSFLLVFQFCSWVEARSSSDEKAALPWQIFLWAFLVTAIRYEGLFLVGLVCLALFYYRNFAGAVKLGALALLPVLVFGLWSMSKGSYFLPNSVLVKSNEVPLFSGGIAHFFETVLVEKLSLIKPGITALATQRLLLLLPAVFFVFRKPLRYQSGYRHILFILTLGALLHLIFASTGKFYRYEAYLMMCSVVICTVIIGNYAKTVFTTNLSRGFALVFFFFLFLPLILRSSAAYTKAGRAYINIYEQQYQMAKFIQKYYGDSAVAANDIGAVSYFTGSYIVDLWGLGNKEIAQSRKDHYWTPQFLDRFCRQKNTRVAIIYDSWFNNSFEHYWKKIANWKISNNVVCGDDNVSFYALDETEAGRLSANLHDFEKYLPPTVKVSYY